PPRAPLSFFVGKGGATAERQNIPLTSLQTPPAPSLDGHRRLCPAAPRALWEPFLIFLGRSESALRRDFPFGKMLGRRLCGGRKGGLTSERQNIPLTSL